MNKELLFASMQGIDDAILARSEKKSLVRHWKKIAAAAACLLIFAAAAIPALRAPESPTPPIGTEPPVQHTPQGSADGDGQSPAGSWTIHYNEPAEYLSPDAAQRYIPGYFTEALSPAELAAVTPETKADWMVCSGRAGFDGEGKLLEIFLQVTSTLPDTVITVTLGGGPLRDYVLPEAQTLSHCNGVAYSVYQWIIGEQAILEAEAEIGGCQFLFHMETSPGDLPQAKADFQEVLTHFAQYAAGGPNLAAVTAESIPEWFDRTLTHQEALADPDLGAWFLPSTPDGFSTESIRRYKDQQSDYLSGLWTKGLHSLSWRVSPFTESHEARLTAVSDKANYDLSLYPIPRAESVPEALREVVDHPIFAIDELTPEVVSARAYTVADAGDEDGWRMEFGVKYGDILVEVSAKGLSPQWVYEQLIALQA